MNVIVTARGEIDLGLPVFRSGAVKVLIVTNPEGARRVRERGFPPPSSSGKRGRGTRSARGRFFPRSAASSPGKSSLSKADRG